MKDSDEVKAILADGRITAEDVLKLRRKVFLKGVSTAADAELMFALNDRLGSQADPSWAPFFVEALTDYIVFQAEPPGYISDENADWLIQHISHWGRVDTATELELLITVLERAKSSPVKLVQFALEQVKWGVVQGEGYIGHSRMLKPGAVGEAEVELLRRILFAYGGDDSIAVTKQEAEVLFDINDATSEADNHPAWSDLFVKSIANFLMSASSYQVPSRQEALQRAVWLDAPTPGMSGFMSQMLAGSLRGIWEAYAHSTASEPNYDLHQLNDAQVEANRITDEDANWLADRIGRDGLLHENELVLINFLKREQTHLHPKLVPILNRAA